MEIVRAEGLGYAYHYDETFVLKGLSFSAESGKITEVALGYGKTTLARLLGGLLIPSEGTLLLKGQPLLSVPKEKRNIAVIFEDYALMKGTVRDNLAFGLKVRGFDKSETERIVALEAEKFSLSDKLDISTRKLSRIDAFMTALARADARKIELLVLDDVFKGLEKEERETARNAVESLIRAHSCAVINISDKGGENE